MLCRFHSQQTAGLLRCSFTLVNRVSTTAQWFAADSALVHHFCRKKDTGAGAVANLTLEIVYQNVWNALCEIWHVAQTENHYVTITYTRSCREPYVIGARILSLLIQTCTSKGSPFSQCDMGNETTTDI